jgi:tetratricopeptide (TPR) repeat protein
MLSITLAATLSRGAWLAGVLAVIVALTAAWQGRSLTIERQAGWTLVGVGLASALWIMLAIRLPLYERVTEGIKSAALSGPARLEIAVAAVRLWRAHPWFGCGPDTFGLLFPGVQTPRFWSQEWIGVPGHAHSAVLQALATGGIIAIGAGVCWLVVMAAGLWTALRGRGTSRVAALECAVAIAALLTAGAFYPVGIAGGTLCAVLAAEVVACFPNGGPVLTRLRHAPSLSLSVGALVALAVAFASMREARALSAGGRARNLLDGLVASSAASDPLSLDELERTASEATSGAPSEDELWRLRSDAELEVALDFARLRKLDIAAAHAATAERIAGQAIALEPHRATNLQRLANAISAQARLATPADGVVPPRSPNLPRWQVLGARADSVFREANMLAPADGLILLDYARCRLELGRPQEALELARRIVRLYPTAATGYAVEGAAFLMLGERDSLRGALRRALAARWDDSNEAQRLVAIRMAQSMDSTVVAH